MRVTVVDRAAMSRAWGAPHPHTVVTRTVEIADTCPNCGGPRGEPCTLRFYEDGHYYSADVWQNPCGHVDSYADALREAEELPGKGAA